MPTFSLVQKHVDLDIHNAEKMIEIAKDTGDTPIAIHVLSCIGDELQLRGIPAIGRGVAGAIIGTTP
jgi:hypothetical protein